MLLLGLGAGPNPAPYACQDTCTLGATGVQEHTDADSCVAAGTSRTQPSAAFSLQCSGCSASVLRYCLRHGGRAF